MNELTEADPSSISLDLKEPNHYRVLKALRIQPDLSGVSLAGETGYRPSSMVYILRSLHHRKLILKSGTGPSGDQGGKPPTLWRLNPDYGFIIGMEITHHHIRSLVMDFAGNRLGEMVETVNREDHPVAWERLIEGMVKRYTDARSKKNAVCLGLGIAITGIVKSETGMVNFSRQLRLSSYPLRKLLESRIDIPVILLNDCNAGALAMRWFPESETMCPTIVYFNFNDETPEYGAGLILEKNLYEGRSGSAGELPSPLINRELLIEQAIEAGFPEIAGHPVFTEADYLSFQTLGDAVREGDAAASWILNRFSDSLAEEIVHVIAFIDPECVALGGNLAEIALPLETWLVPKIQDIVNRRFEYSMQLPRLVYSPHGGYSGAMGAASAVFRELFNPIGGR